MICRCRNALVAGSYGAYQVPYSAVFPQAGSEHAKMAVCVGMREGGAPSCSLL